MITLDISFVHFQKGKPLWKHNNSLLNDKDYLKAINNRIDEVKKQYVYNMDQIDNVPDDEIQFVINDQLFLETLLMELRGKSISFSSYKKKIEEQKEKKIISNIETLESNMSSANLDELETLKEELQNIRKKQNARGLSESKSKNHWRRWKTH